MGRKRQMKLFLVLCISPLFLLLYKHMQAREMTLGINLLRLSSHDSFTNSSVLLTEKDKRKGRQKHIENAKGMHPIDLGMESMIHRTHGVERHHEGLGQGGRNGPMPRTSFRSGKHLEGDDHRGTTTILRITQRIELDYDGPVNNPFGYKGEDVIIQNRLTNGSVVRLKDRDAAERYHRQRMEMLPPVHQHARILRHDLQKDFYRHRGKRADSHDPTTRHRNHVVSARERRVRNFTLNAGAEEWMAYTAYRNKIVSTKAILWDEEWMHNFAKKSMIDLMDITIVGKGILPMRANDFTIKSSMVGKTLQDLREKIRVELLRMDRIQPTKAVEYDRDNLPMKLYDLAPYLLDKIPHEFLPNIKNPCWLNKGDKFLSCLPYFYLLGAPKSATTDLWTRISNHPYVINAYNKEPQFWTRGNLVKGLLKYCANYLMISQAIATRIKANSTMISGDGTASNFWERRRAQILYGQQPDGPPYFTADLIRAIQPNAKLIIIVREPSSRLYSEYLDLDAFWPLFKSPEDFHVRVEDIIGHFNRCIEEGYHVAGCASNYYQPRLQIGMYSVHIREWLKRFPVEQILVLRTEDWAENPHIILKKVFQFLNLSETSTNLINKLTAISRQNQRKKKNQQIGAMLPETRQLLDSFYQPFNEDLARLMKDDRYMWKDEQ